MIKPLFKSLITTNSQLKRTWIDNTRQSDKSHWGANIKYTVAQVILGREEREKKKRVSKCHLGML